MKTFIFLLLLTAATGMTACSTAEQGQTNRDTLSLDTLSTPTSGDSLEKEGLKKDTMPAKKDTV